MEEGKPRHERIITIRDLYPDKSEEELRIAEENWERYLKLALRAYERIRSDPEAYARFKALTASFWSHRIGIVPSNPPENSHTSQS